jgi:hypothetical protein
MFLLFIFLLSAPSTAEELATHQQIRIYVDISEVTAPDGSKGTSTILNSLITRTAQIVSVLEHRMNYLTGPDTWRGEISVWDHTNVIYMPGYKKCDYSNSIKCGIQNNHWTIKTNVDVSQKYAVVTQKLYNEKGAIIGSSSQTAWGTVRWKPQWKLTTIKEQGAFGGSSREIFEMWPPQIEELPPLIKPYHISQARYSLYTVNKKACKINTCFR